MRPAVQGRPTATRKAGKAPAARPTTRTGPGRVAARTMSEKAVSSTGRKGQRGSRQGGTSGGEDAPPRGNPLLLPLFGFWAAMLSCLSNAAVSLEGDLEPPRFLTPRFNVDRILRRNEKTSRPPAASGVVRYDSCGMESNDPAEDEHAEAVLPVPSGYWSFFGIFDGHNGGDTSKWLADHLVPAVAGALGDLYSSLAGTDDAPHPEPDPSSISETLKKTFLQLDDDIVNGKLKAALASGSREACLALLGPANAGSCALLGFYDSHSRRIHMALTGDSRAVLGRRRVNEEGKLRYDVYILTTEQNGYNEDEIARLNSEHSGEVVVQEGRVFGMAVSRAFGDARYKWSCQDQERLNRRYRLPVPEEMQTPPYITAEPAVTSIEVQLGDFLILGCDGLWESLTSEEAVGLVGLWKEGQRNGVPRREPVGGFPPHVLPVWMPEHDDTLRYRQWGAEKRFVREDKNAATHLLRNALGGADRELMSSLLAMRSPRARAYRDDMTASVIFFPDEDGWTGDGL